MEMVWHDFLATFPTGILPRANMPIGKVRAYSCCLHKTTLLQAKNDFLSGVLLTQGLAGFHTAGYGESLSRDTRVWSWRNSSKEFLFNNWNPGKSQKLQAFKSKMSSSKGTACERSFNPK